MNFIKYIIISLLLTTLFYFYRSQERTLGELIKFMVVIVVILAVSDFMVPNYVILKPKDVEVMVEGMVSGHPDPSKICGQKIPDKVPDMSTNPSYYVSNPHQSQTEGMDDRVMMDYYKKNRTPPLSSCDCEEEGCGCAGPYFRDIIIDDKVAQYSKMKPITEVPQPEGLEQLKAGIVYATPEPMPQLKEKIMYPLLESTTVDKEEVPSDFLVKNNVKRGGWPC